MVTLMVDPYPRGYGTHVQLGLTSCGFLARTGYPCLGCGFTTSLAAMAHGRFGLALEANAFGVAVFAAVAAAAVLGLAEALTGRGWFNRLRLNRWWLVVAVVGWLLAWAVKVAMGAAAGIYPIGR
jgi:hypothetical protein